MAFAFDTFGHAKRLELAGVERRQAEVHAEAAREFVMTELVTRSDLRDALERQSLELTLRLGGLIAAGFAGLAVLIKVL